MLFFDFSSLLIALLRVSGIQARYAYGSVEIEIDQIMNWVGGAEVPEAALDFMSQGGIPVVAEIRAGEITSVIMEHIWVEAFVDFEPGRGLYDDSRDSWVPMDASWKQYDYSEGLELDKELTANAASLFDQVVAGVSMDEVSGSIEGLNDEVIEDVYINFKEKIDRF